MGIDQRAQKAFEAQERREARKLAKVQHRQERARTSRDLDAMASYLLGEGRSPAPTGFGRRGTVRGIAGIAGFQRA